MNEFEEYLVNPIFQQFAFVFIATIVILVISSIVKNIIPRYVAKSQSRYRIRKFITYLSYFVIMIMIATVYSSKFTGLGVFLGVAGAGIAFALQEVIASIAGFIAINFSNFYDVGDRVMLGGIKGDVVDIGVLRTSVMQMGDWVNGDLYNGKIVRISNSFIFKEPVFNYSGDFPFLWDEISIPIKSNSDYTLAKEIFLTILNETQGEYAEGAKIKWAKMTEKFQLENAQVSPMVTMSFNENWITYTLRFVVDFKKRRSTKDILYTKILQAIQASDGKIEIASSSLDVSLKGNILGSSSKN